MFNGLGMHMGNLSRLSPARTRSISAENPRGEKGRAAMGMEGTGAHFARNIGEGWKVSPSVVVPAGTTYTVADIEGPGAIQSFWIGGSLGRHILLRFYWDGQERPSVEAPITDFFAFFWPDQNQDSSTGRFPTLQSLPVLVAPNRGYNCFWEMPFRQRCRITVENRSDQDAIVYYQVNYALTEVPEDAAYFHAQYRQARPVEGGVYTLLDGGQGRGHYVGTALGVGINGHGGWWGEGEIKFYLDGDGAYPTICGTGTEDYFGGAYDWMAGGAYNTYSAPYMGMYHVIAPDGRYNSQQRFSLYRWHIPDPIRFESDLKVTIQDLGWRGDRTYLPRKDDFFSMAYWYQTLPTASFPALPGGYDLEVL